MVSGAAALLALGVAIAAAASSTLTHSFDGSTPDLVLFNFTGACDACIPDDVYQALGGDGEGDIALGFNISATSKASYEGNTDTEVTWTPGLVRQGSELDTSNTLTTLPGTAKISYTLTGTVGVFHDPDGGADNFSPVPGETTSLSHTFTQSIPCTLPLPGEAPRECSKEDFVDILTINLIVDITLRLGIETSITLNSDGVVTIRKAAAAGGPPIPNKELTFIGTSPSTVADPIFVTCTQPVGTDFTYALTNTTYRSPNTTATYSVFLNALVEDPVAGIDLFDADLTPHVPIVNFAYGTLTATAPDKQANLGPVLPDATPPTINSVGGPYSGVEGTAITFTADAEDNCGPPLLRWDFSDGGVAYGNGVQHTFADNGVYSVLLTATDVTGLSSTATFNVTVSNVAPTVDAGPNMSFDWGVPVPFHANGLDAGAVDKLSLLYTWNFDDPNDPLGAAGQNVVHTYSQPGTSNVQVTVRDKDGATGTDTVTVTITRRDTVVSYTGTLAGNITDSILLRASVIDEYGQPVTGRPVTFSVDGNPVGSALTNGVGVAQLAWTIPLGTSAGSHTVEANFAGDAKYFGDGSGASTLTVGREPTVLVYTGVLKSKPSKAVPVSAKLTDDEGNAIAGMTIDFALGTQTCSGVTNSSGVASCSIPKLTQKPGNYTITVTFAGTANYLPANDSDPFTIG
jgi:PKD repeat protein